MTTSSWLVISSSNWTELIRWVAISMAFTRVVSIFHRTAWAEMSFGPNQVLWNSSKQVKINQMGSIRSLVYIFIIPCFDFSTICVRVCKSNCFAAKATGLIGPICMYSRRLSICGCRVENWRQGDHKPVTIWLGYKFRWRIFSGKKSGNEFQPEHTHNSFEHDQSAQFVRMRLQRFNTSQTVQCVGYW